MTGVCHTHQRHRELHLTDSQMERAKPTVEHILVVTSPQSLYSGCWRAASALPGPEPSSRRWKRREAAAGQAEEDTGVHPNSPPQPTPLPDHCCLGEQPHKAFSWRNERGDAFGAYTGRMAER